MSSSIVPRRLGGGSFIALEYPKGASGHGVAELKNIVDGWVRRCYSATVNNNETDGPTLYIGKNDVVGDMDAALAYAAATRSLPLQDVALSQVWVGGSEVRDGDLSKMTSLLESSGARW